MFNVLQKTDIHLPFPFATKFIANFTYQDKPEMNKYAIKTIIDKDYSYLFLFI